MAVAGHGSSVTVCAASTVGCKVVLQPMPTGLACPNFILLNCNLNGRWYRIENFRQEFKRLAALSDVVALGTFKMNHIWLATLQLPEAKDRLLAHKELEVMNHK